MGTHIAECMANATWKYTPCQEPGKSTSTQYTLPIILQGNVYRIIMHLLVIFVYSSSSTFYQSIGGPIIPLIF